MMEWLLLCMGGLHCILLMLILIVLLDIEKNTRAPEE